MKKGMSVVIFLGAVIVFLFSVYVAWSFIYGKKITRPQVDLRNETEEEVEQACLTDENCKKNPYGSKCFSDVYDPNYPNTLTSFCGCDLNEHCESTADVTRGDVCGKNNRCE